MKISQKGFTLIELLVVISIISLLSSVVLGSVAQARVRGRDVARIQQIHQIDLAVQLYVSSNGRAPDLGGSCPSSITLATNSVANCVAKSSAVSGSAQGLAWERFKLDLQNGGFMKGVPADSCGVSCVGGLGYVYVAPAAMKYACSANPSCSISSVSNTSYQLYGKLQGSSKTTGVSTFGAFFTPPDASSY